MQALEIVLTVAIVLAAAAWAGRRLLRLGRRRASTEPSDCAPGCAAETTGCGSCPVRTLQVRDGTPRPPAPQDDET